VKKNLLVASIFIVLTAVVTFAIGPEGGIPEPLGSDVGQFLSRQFYALFLAIGIGYSLLSPLETNEPRWSRIGFVLGVVLVCLLVEATLDHLIWEPRPGWVNVFGKSSGFPSGHAMGSFAMASVITLLRPQLTLIAFGSAFLVAYSRVEVVAHYPHQVVVGAILGTMISFWIMGFRKIWLINRIKNRKSLAQPQIS
jgi:membrane-associated phospholipid phosphatase